MSEQYNLIDAIAAADAAIASADDALSVYWRRAALEAVESVARWRETFTTDDVWKLLEREDRGRPAEPRAMGAIMRHAVAAGYCEPTADWVATGHIKSHNRPRRVWRSLIWQGTK